MSVCFVIACTNTLMSISIDPFFPINTMIFFFHLARSFDIPILSSKNFLFYIVGLALERKKQNKMKNTKHLHVAECIEHFIRDATLYE